MYLPWTRQLCFIPVNSNRRRHTLTLGCNGTHRIVNEKGEE